MEWTERKENKASLVLMEQKEKKVILAHLQDNLKI